MIYMDYAAATPLDPRVQAAMEPFFVEQFYNPSALYLASKQVAKALADARTQVALQLGARPAEIIFTAGGTEANNLAIHGVMQAFPGAKCIVSAIEHEAVLEPAKQYNCQLAPVQLDGRLDLPALEKLIDDQTVLLSVMYANNEIGTVEPLKEVGQLVARIRADRHKRGIKLPLYLHSDACQAANYLDLQVARLGVDLLTLNAGKMYGPKQCGVLYVRASTVLQPLVYGGGQERGLRSGTENVANCVGFAQALTIAQTSRHDEAQRLLELRQEFIKQIQAQLPEAVINGSLEHRLPNNVHVTFPDTDNERLLMELDERGIMCATGSACTASNDEPSHVLKALGLSDQDAQSSLRFTMGRATTAQEVEAVVAALVELIRK